MNIVKIEFLKGFSEGWSMFWSPFVGIYQAAKSIISPLVKKQNAHVLYRRTK
jgi:hypothetical protein